MKLTSHVCESRDTAMLLNPITMAKKEFKFWYSLQLKRSDRFIILRDRFHCSCSSQCTGIGDNYSKFWYKKVNTLWCYHFLGFLSWFLEKFSFYSILWNNMQTDKTPEYLFNRTEKKVFYSIICNLLRSYFDKFPQ